MSSEGPDLTEYDAENEGGTSWPKAAAGYVLQALFSIYWIGFFIAAPYFNWCYGRDNGFMSWLFLGEIAATAQGLVWPYYAFVGGEGSDLSEEDKAGLAQFNLVINLRNTAMHTLAPPGDEMVYTLTEETRKRGVALLKQSLEESKRVPDSVLSKLHEELPSRMESQFRRGLELYIGSFEHPNVANALEGQMLLDEFGEWYAREVKR